MAQVIPSVLAYLASAVVASALAGLAYRRREEPGGTALALFLLAVAVGAIGQAGFDASTTRAGKELFLRLGFAGTILVPTTWLYFAIVYTGREKWLSRPVLVLLVGEPAVMGVIFLTPAFDGLAWTLGPLERSGDMVTMAVTPGLAMGLHFAYYFAGLLIGTVLFLRLFLQARHLYRTQAGALLFGSLIPWAGHALRLTGVADRIDFTPLLLTAAGTGMVLALYQVRLIDPVPTARRSVVEEMGDGVVVLDDCERVGDVNPAAMAMLAPESDRESMLGTVVDDLVADAVTGIDDGDAVERGVGTDGGDTIAESALEWSTVRERLDADTWTELILSSNGDRRFVEAQLTPFRDRHDRPVGNLLVLRDVTARRERERELARYETIFETVRDQVYVLDETGRFIVLNEPLASMLGYERAELLGEPFERILADGDGAGVGDNNLGSGGGIEVTIETATGERIPCETYRAPITFEGDSAGTVGVVRDVSRRKSVERRFRRTSGTLETLVEASPLSIVAVAPDGTVEVWNEAAESTFGWSAKEVLGEPLPVISEDAADRLRKIYERVLDGERLTGLELPLERADGQLIDANVSAAPQYGDDDEVVRVVAVIEDASERKARERELKRQNDQLEEFASVLSHDVRNPLEVAQGYLKLGADDIDPDYYDRIERAHDRIERLTDDLLALARQGQRIEETETVGLERVAREAWATVDTGTATLLTTDLDVEADRERLRQALENLFDNAVEHGGSDVTVRVSPLDGETGFFVADDGPGIPSDDRQTVFERGYTTEGDGTGFGLAIVRRIAQAHGWDVSVGKSDDGGARFVVTTDPERTGDVDADAADAASDASV